MDTDIINYTLKDLPIDSVECDKEQPRKNPNNEIALRSLKASVKQHGIQQPITVTEIEDGRFIIIDGHRRYYCAKNLGFEMLPCLIYPKLTDGEFEIRRYAMQNLRRPWKPLERSDALHRMKDTMGFQSIKDLSRCIGISESAAADYLFLREQQLHLLDRLADFGLNASFQTEIVRLKPHLRKVAGLDVDEIIDNILNRIATEKNNYEGSIKNSKEMRIIKSAFIRIDLYGDLLANYLNNPEMKTTELEEQILRNGFSWDVQKVVAAVAKKHSRGERFTEKEDLALSQLKELIDQVSRELVA